MCRAVTCKHCAKITWSGCGMHVATVKAGVPADMWCSGHPDQPRRGLLDRLRGR